MNGRGRLRFGHRCRATIAGFDYWIFIFGEDFGLFFGPSYLFGALEGHRLGWSVCRLLRRRCLRFQQYDWHFHDYYYYLDDFIIAATSCAHPEHSCCW